MTPEEQRIEISWFRGLRWFRSPEEDASVLRVLPDYPNDLNSICEAEKMLNHDGWRIYIGFLMGNRVIPKLASMEEFHKAWNATAAQRSEAFLRTVGKWKD